MSGERLSAMTSSTKLDFPVRPSRRRIAAGSAGGPALRALSIPSVNSHKLSDVRTIDIGDGTTSRQDVDILAKAKSPPNCTISPPAFI